MSTSVKEKIISQKSAATRRDILYGAAVGALSQTVSLSFGAGNVHAQPENKPNILLIYSDQHRPDAMGCAGDPVVVTPHLDRLAREGTRFSRMWCQSPLCRPSRASLITGLYPHEHGATGNMSPAFDPAWPTFMKKLQAAGYTTASFGKTHYAVPDIDFENPTKNSDYDVRNHYDYIRSFGFDHVLEETGQFEAAIEGFRSSYTEFLEARGLLKTFRDEIRANWRLTGDHFAPYVTAIPQEADITSFVAAQTIEWIESRDSTKPFFITFAPIKPHVPLAGDPIWATYYADKEMPSGPRDMVRNPNAVWANWMKRRYEISHPEQLTEERIAQSKRMYYAMISLVDQKIGEIMGVLNKRGELDNTWIIYTCDHGEMMGDHRLMAKQVFYHPAVGVPSLIRPPHGAPARRLVADPTETIDVTATILDIAGAGALPKSSGVSLLPAMNGKISQNARAYSEVTDGDDNPYFVAVLDGAYRYTVDYRSGTACELFDLHNDPSEVINLVDDPAYKPRIADMQASVAAHMKDASF